LQETLYENDKGPVVYLIDFSVKAPQQRMQAKLVIELVSD